MGRRAQQMLRSPRCYAVTKGGVVVYLEPRCPQDLTDLHQGDFPRRLLRGLGGDLGGGRGCGRQGPRSPGPTPLFRPPRPWSWTPSIATTGASRAVALSPGRTSYSALTGSWMTFPAASSQPTEALRMPPTSQSSPAPAPSPHQAPSLGEWESASLANTPDPAPKAAALWPAGSRGWRAAALAPDTARPQPPSREEREERAGPGRGPPLLLPRLWASSFAQP